MTDFGELFRRLSDAHVEFVVIGGLAVIAHGHVRATLDLDICYARTADNLQRLADALAPLRPTLRGAPPELPFVWDAETIRSGLNFTLSTALGPIDALGEVPGLGGFEAVRAAASEMELDGLSVQVLTAAGLERAKRAAGRAKDLIDLEELRELRRQAEKP